MTRFPHVATERKSPWGPEDWDAFTLGVAAEDDAPPPPEHAAVAELLRRLPGRSRKTVADLGCGRGEWLPFLKRHFREVVAVDYAPATLAAARRREAAAGVIFRRRDLRDLTPFRGTLHVALLLDSLPGPRVEDVDRVLAEVHAALVEGGIAVLTVPAAPRRGKARPMRLAGVDGPETLTFTETDLQYRLRRAGYLGMSLRRFEGGGRGDRLLAVAMRRANN